VAVTVGPVTIGGGQPFAWIAGPCVLEDADEALALAAALADIARRAGVPFVFKASFDKANRTSGTAYRGPGLADGLALLARIRREIGVPVTTDIHEPDQAEPVAAVVDLLQIPAFLSRQTDLVVAAARTGRPVNIKKGPFAAPKDLQHAVAKAQAAGDGGALVTERGTTFGYGDLVVDLRGLPILRAAAPVVLDVTHACQRPAAEGDRSGGDRSFAAALGRAGLAVGVDAIFSEVHPDPDRARSDAATQLPLAAVPAILDGWRRVADALAR
jgi:2-dehydro-3-deoxyphosphooctonate aldolase (KDO 8-P synthase)